MVLLAHLWLPILLSAVFVFIASSLIHMALKWHNSDYHGFSNEDEVRAAITKGSPAPGQYTLPYCADHKDFGTEAMKTKLKDGPVGFMILRAPGPMSMGPMLEKVWRATRNQRPAMRSRMFRLIIRRLAAS